MENDLPAPMFKQFERVVVTGQGPRCERWKGERGTVISIDSHYVWRSKQPDQWLYIVHIPTQNLWWTFCQIDLQSEGCVAGESDHFGTRPEISFDSVLEENSDWVEGCYRLPGELWKIVIFRRDDVHELQFEPNRWPKPSNWEREATGVVIRIPRTANMGRQNLLDAMSIVFGYSDWVQVHGPDSMVLR